MRLDATLPVRLTWLVNYFHLHFNLQLHTTRCYAEETVHPPAVMSEASILNLIPLHKGTGTGSGL